MKFKRNLALFLILSIIISCLIFLVRFFGDETVNIINSALLTSCLIIFIFIISYYLTDINKKDKNLLITLFSILTIITLIILLLLKGSFYYFNTNEFWSSLRYYIYVGFFEEYIKFSVILITMLLFKEKDITFGNLVKDYILVSLFFGLLEILLIGIVNRLAAPILHITYFILPFSILTVKYYDKFIDLFYEPIKNFRFEFILFFIIAGLLHWLFDLSSKFNPYHFIIGVILIIIGLLLAVYYLNLSSNSEQNTEFY